MNEAWAAAFNRWMDDFVNNPEKFESTTKAALDHYRARQEGREPTYGERCAITLAEYLKASS